jgi:hypothetical protein
MQWWNPIAPGSIANFKVLQHFEEHAHCRLQMFFSGKAESLLKYTFLQLTQVAAVLRRLSDRHWYCEQDPKIGIKHCLAFKSKKRSLKC